MRIWLLKNQKTLNMEKEALKKLDNVKKDQEGRVQTLEESQGKSRIIAERIIMNKVSITLYVVEVFCRSL